MALDFGPQRSALYQANVRSLEARVGLETGRKLDSSLKKNTSFIKKIKGLNADTAPGILAEISALTLEKYLSEITASLAEGLLKLSKSDDLNAGVLVISALFQRFGLLFSSVLLLYLVNAVLDKASEEPSLKQKTALKLVFEMHLVGISTAFSECAPGILSEPATAFYLKFGSSMVTVTLLKNLMTYKTDHGYALPAITTFLRRFSPLINGNDGVLPGILRSVLQQLFSVYTTRILEILEALHVKVLELELSNKKASIRTGKILPEHQDLMGDITQRKALFQTNATVLCELLHVELPALKAAIVDEPERGSVPEETKKTWWHDAKEREFYQDVPSYNDVVENFDRKKLPEAEYGSLSDGQKVILFISQLEALVDAKDVDLMTVVMHTYIPYNKATKHRIVRFFTEVKKTDNVNLHARFLRINAGFFPDVISELIDSLDRGFRLQIHFDTLNFRNLVFFIEMVKFKLIPSHVIFHKIRRMTLRIAGTNNVDILLVFYERCGRFLLFEPEYMQTTREMLDLLQAQAKSDKLTINEKLSLANMFLIVDSFTAAPGAAQKQAARPELTVVQDFVHQCVKKLVTPTSCVTALELLGSIDFSGNCEARTTLVDVFLRPEDLGSDRLAMLAELLVGIGRTHLHVAISVVDALTEKVIRGLELNDYRHNMSRVAQVKMFAAFFNARLLDVRSIVDLLYKIVCFGYPNNLPTPQNSLDIDPPDNYFRIHLVCTLLNAVNFHEVTATGHLTLGVKTAEGFLVFLQYYLHCKVVPLPKDIEFALLSVLESFNAFSKMKLQKPSDLTSATEALQRYIQTQTQTQSQIQKEPDSAEALRVSAQRDEIVDSSESKLSLSEPSSSAEDNLDSDSEDLAAYNDIENDLENSIENDTENDDSLSDSNSELSENLENSEDSEDSLDNEAELDYDDVNIEEEGQRLFQLRSAARKVEAQRMDDEIHYLLSASVHQSKVAVPLKMPAPSALAVSPSQIPASSIGKEPTKMFKFLTKANSLRDLILPANNQFTQRIALEQEAQKANRRKIMSLVNDMYDD